MLVEKTPLVITNIDRLEIVAVLRRKTRLRRSRRAFLGAVVLDHEVLDAVHGGVEGQVAAAGAGGAAGAQGVGAQRGAEGGSALGAPQLQRGRHVG